jgi:protocatechuate 3,4-dioxygenase beta subunit
MRFISHLFIAILVSLVSIPGHAECSLTPALKVTNYPGKQAIPSSNNLIKPAGKSIDAEGQRLTLIGRVLDKNCLPVKDAQVEIWQPDPFGKWVFASRAELANPHPVFAGAGRASTNANGAFTFITLFPAPVEKNAPTIRIRVVAPDMKPFETLLFFENDYRNAADPIYQKLSTQAQQSVTLRMNALSGLPGYAGLIDIVLSGEAPYVTY